MLNGCDGLGLPASWLSLDEADNDPTRFMAYFIATIQTIQPGFGESVQAMSPITAAHHPWKSS